MDAKITKELLLAKGWKLLYEDDLFPRYEKDLALRHDTDPKEGEEGYERMALAYANIGTGYWFYLSLPNQVDVLLDVKCYEDLEAIERMVYHAEDGIHWPPVESAYHHEFEDESTVEDRA